MVTRPETIEIRVDAGQAFGELPHNWKSIGYDEINYTYTPEGQELLSKFGALRDKPHYVRAHHLQTVPGHVCSSQGQLWAKA